MTRLELHTDAVRCLAELPAAISGTSVSSRVTVRRSVASSVRSDRVPDRGHGVRESCADARGDARWPSPSTAVDCSPRARIRTCGVGSSGVDGRGLVLLRAFLGGHAGFVASLAVDRRSNARRLRWGGKPGGFWRTGDGCVKVCGARRKVSANRRRARRSVSLETRIKPATRTETRTITSGAGKGGDEKDVAGNGGDEKDVAGTIALTLVAASSEGYVPGSKSWPTPRGSGTGGVGFTWNAGFFASAERTRPEPDEKHRGDGSMSQSTPGRDEPTVSVSPTYFHCLLFFFLFDVALREHHPNHPRRRSLVSLVSLVHLLLRLLLHPALRLGRARLFPPYLASSAEEIFPGPRAS